MKLTLLRNSNRCIKKPVIKEMRRKLTGQYAITCLGDFLSPADFVGPLLSAASESSLRTGFKIPFRQWILFRSRRKPFTRTSNAGQHVGIVFASPLRQICSDLHAGLSKII
ncbi:hypothetical protein NDU88_002091 [Pleurodeles waltl]|uniref:Uncharacterized protein n=1 Tax=Pleurodeles waltl TaxID=8319 RepID=A0AAV7VYC6_PLEWA|nr:hypothetical protein NDU88_002091 [Pleurodeles waltl]